MSWPGMLLLSSTAPAGMTLLLVATIWTGVLMLLKGA
jgi:hypothetical protein